MVLPKGKELINVLILKFRRIFIQPRVSQLLSSLVAQLLRNLHGIKMLWVSSLQHLHMFTNLLCKNSMLNQLFHVLKSNTCRMINFFYSCKLVLFIHR